MSLTINIKKDATVATVTTEEEGKSNNKVISLENLIKLFTSLNFKDIFMELFYEKSN